MPQYQFWCTEKGLSKQAAYFLSSVPSSCLQSLQQRDSQELPAVNASLAWWFRLVIPTTLKTEAGVSQAQGQLVQFSETLSQSKK